MFALDILECEVLKRSALVTDGLKRAVARVSASKFLGKSTINTKVNEQLEYRKKVTITTRENVPSLQVHL